jgi:phospholipid transport system transporter-binding protein
MIALDGDVLKVGGEMRLAEAALLRDAGLALITRAKSIDLSGVGSVDSSALAILIAWERASGSMDDGPLPVVGAPEGLRSLAHLYEVGSYCGLDADSSAR